MATCHKRKVIENEPSTVLSTDIVTREEELAHSRLMDTLQVANRIEGYISNPRRSKEATISDDAQILEEICMMAQDVSTSCAVRRESARQQWEREGLPPLLLREDDRVTDEHLVLGTRFTDAVPLETFNRLERYVPRLVNVVTLGLVSPTPGSKTTLPLNLEHIATRCTGAFFAPRRFAAVQLAFHKWPRARVLVFRTPIHSPKHTCRLRPKLAPLPPSRYRETRRHRFDRNNLGPVGDHASDLTTSH